MSAETDCIAAVTKFAAMCGMLVVSPAGELVMVIGNIGLRWMERMTEDDSKRRSLGMAGNVGLSMLAWCVSPVSFSAFLIMAVVNWWMFHLGVDPLNMSAEEPQ